MRKDDTELIRRTLTGDEIAFTLLVNKYRKHVHTLAWHKVGDFHIAEDITQEVFLQVYRDLETLREPDRFPGWLYVITTHCCIAWSRKNRLHIRLVEDINMAMKGKATYSRHVADEQAKTTAVAQREVVKQLLSKLQESERTVMTLYYFGEMTCEEISKFLGVSANTIKSRLSRARQRLKKEEPMIREALNSFQLSANLTENIVREIAHIKPVAPSGSKPFVPWAIVVSTLAAVLLMIGVGNQYLTHFQQPYSFDATSEMTVDIIDASVVLNLESKPDVRTQLGNSITPVKNNGAGQQLNQPEYLARLAAAPVDAEEITDPNEGEHYITLSASATTESGEHLAQGTFNLRETGSALTSRGYFTRGSGGSDPSPRYMLLYYIAPHEIDLLRFPLSVGNTWTKTRGQWNSQTKTTLQSYEQVEVSAGIFPDCLKHRTIFTDAETDSQLKNDLVDGTRYLWFAKGVGVVKMRFEHANGVITEAELLEYNVPVKDEEYLPLQAGNAWTYKWQNDYREEASIEACHVVEYSDKPPDQDTTSPEVERIIPDLSEKVSMDLKAIKIVFSEIMIGMDVEFAGVPVGDIQWEDGSTTLVISFERPLESSKIYRLILGVDGNIRDVAGNPLEEHTLIFTTKGPDPATPTFVDTTPVHVKGIEKLNLSSDLFCRVSTEFTDGFAFPYYLFIPRGIDSNTPVHLLVEPCNTGPVRNFKSLDRKTRALAEKSYANVIARKLKTPLLVPVFPRPGGDRWQIYTHSLDRDTLLIKEGELRRIDLQLIKMITHAQELLRHNNVQVNEKVFMNGFSASGTFTNRFAILHPTIVRAVATGGVNSIPTFPTSRWNDTLMRYPVGIADVKEIADIDFDETAYKHVSQYIYMGALDNNDTVPYRDAYDEVDAELIKSLIGTEMMPERWDVSQSIYKALGVPAQFVTYENAGHEITSEMIDDIVAFFETNSGNEIVEIVPHQYPSEE